VDVWSPEETGEIVVGRRRMRGGRRRYHVPGHRPLIIAAIALVVAGALVGGYFWFIRPKGMAALPNPAVVAPGGFRASIGDANTITVGLEVRNVTDTPLTLVEARVVPPAGLTLVKLSVAPTGPENEGFALEGDLPASTSVNLGTAVADRNAIIAARFTVNCAELPKADAFSGEQIFVTIQLGQEKRTEELTPPVVGDMPWLTATARRVCLDPVPTGSAEPPLPVLPNVTATTGSGA
jgi:hypothetical protein